MFNKEFAALSATACMLCLHADQKKVCQQKPKNHDSVISFLKEHQYDHSIFASLNFDFTLSHDHEFNKFNWLSLEGKFAELAILCDKSQKDETDTRWLDILGSPFKEILYFKRHYGIHGFITIELGCCEDIQKDTIKIYGKIYHDEDYDKQAWQHIIDIMVDYAQRIESKHHEIEKLVGPIFRESIKTVSDDETLHGSLCFFWKNINDEMSFQTDWQ